MIKIYIDNDIFYREGYNFDTEVYRILEKRIKNKEIELYGSSITDREVERHIRKKAEDEIKIGFGKKELNEHFRKDNLKEPLVKTIVDRIKNKYNSLGVIQIDVFKHSDPKNIFDDYFNIAPPFEDNKEKKFEFPDAFMLNAIKNYDKEIILISGDEGWKKFAEKHDMKCYKHFEKEILEKIAEQETQEKELIKYLKDHLDRDETLIKKIEEHVLSLEVIPDWCRFLDDDKFDAEAYIESFNEILDFSIIDSGVEESTEEKIFVFTINLNLSLSIFQSGYDLEEMSRDSGEWVPMWKDCKEERITINDFPCAIEISIEWDNEKNMAGLIEVLKIESEQKIDLSNLSDHEGRCFYDYEIEPIKDGRDDFYDD